MKHCVVARYKEDTSWLGNLRDFTFYIYNKYDKEPNGLPNVGREVQTFIYHIHSHYDNLADTTVFLQGNPFDHCQPTVLDLVNDIEKVMGEKKYLDLGNYKLIEHRDGVVLSNGQQPKVPMPFCQYYSDVFRQRCPDYFEFTVGLNCAIKKDAILARPKDFYKRILDLFNREGDKPAWMIERFWSLIFK